MKRLKLGVVFGGMSTENEVSVVSAQSVLNNLNSEKYEIFPIYIDKKGMWYECFREALTGDFGGVIQNKNKIENVIEYLKKLDLVFPVLHGLYGEDGTIQGLFELIKIPYVGCGVLASSVGMDKVYTKIVFEKAGLKQAEYVYLRKYKEEYILLDSKLQEKRVNIKEAVEIIGKKIEYPMFVKPSNSGSSVGIKKVKNIEELEEAIKYAAKFDHKILVEQGIIGKEVECAVLGNENVIASCVGEIKAADEFYSYDAKYFNHDSKTLIPAEISDEKSEEIRNLAIHAFKAIDGKGLSRVDFFVEDSTQDVYINEINTMPGFTSISMYPKLFEAVGLGYRELLDKLVELQFTT